MWGRVDMAESEGGSEVSEMYLNARKPDVVFSRPVKPVSIR